MTETQMQVKVDKYHVQAPINNLLTTFRAIHAGDKAAEAAASKYALYAGLCFIGAIGGAIAGANMKGGAQTAAIAGAGLCAVGLIVFLIKYFHSKNFDLDDRKIATVLQFLKIVAADTPKAAPLDIQVDFRPYKEGGTKDGYEKQGGMFSMAQTVYTYKYSHNWLTIGGSLADGNGYQIRVMDRITRKEKPKRKYTKVRESIKGSVQLALKLKPRYGDPQGILNALNASPPPAPLRLVKARLSGRRLLAELAKPPALRTQTRYGGAEPKEDDFINGHSLLKTLLWAYGAIGKGATKPGAAG